VLLNIRSVVSKEKRENLEILLEGIKPAPILFLTETFIKEGDSKSQFPFASRCAIYSHERVYGKRRAGGCAILVPKCYPSMAISNVINPVKFESVWCKIVCPNRAVNLGCVYRAPDRTETSAINVSHFLEAHFKTNSGPTVMAGDFNCPGIDWVNHKASNQFAQSKFMDTVNSLGLSQLVDFPTRKHNILDLYFSNEPNLIQNVTLGPSVPMCDHKTVLASLSVQRIQSKKITFRDYAKADYNIIAPSVLNLDWKFLDEKSDVNNKWLTFKSKLTKLINAFIPIRTVQSNPNCQFSTQTTKLYRERFKMHCKLKKHPTNVNLRARYIEISRLARQKKRSDIIRAENKVLSANNPKKFWTFVKSKMSYKSSIPCILSSDGKTVLSENIDKAECFNSYFCSVFSKDNDEPPELQFPQSASFLSQVDFSPEIVYSKLTELPNKLSYGPDEIPASIYKNLSVPLAEPLSKIFKASFDQSRIPDDWHLANVVPIHKKGPTNLCSNYRPISLECQASKIQESIVNDALLVHFKDKFSKNQHGFLKRRSTVTQLLETLNDWTRALNGGQVIDVQYIDWSKAFDTISHPILIKKLRRYGVVGSLLDWIKAFLKNRKQRVLVDGCLSSEGEVSSSVPQGSVISPTLFLIFINDLEAVFIHSKIRLFADDSKYYIIFLHENSEAARLNMQTDNEALVLWGKENKMRIAFTKCATLHIGYRNPCNEYKFDDFPIPNVDEIRDLGVLIDKELKFSAHIIKICKSASSVCHLIFRSFHNKSRTFLINLFSVYARSKLEYASQVWNPHLIKDIDRIEKIQRRFTKRIPGLQNLAYSNRLKILGLERLELRRLHLDLVLVYKITHGMIDLCFDDYFSLKESNTRGHSLTLSINRCQKDVRKYFFSNRVVHWWNFLSEVTVNASNLNTFKQLILKEDLSRFLKGGGD